MRYSLLMALIALALSAQAPSKKGSSSVNHQPYGKMPDGTPVEIYTLSNAKGMRAEIITYGGAVVRLTAPDRTGKYADIVLGMDSLEGYIGQSSHFGALIGRYGNRIGHAAFTLEGKGYHLPKNDGENTLHGGPDGFDRRVWKAREAGGGLELTYVSADGEEGFPGTLTAKATYTLTDQNELKIDYTATTDKPTVVNLTNHSYFNLAGAGAGTVLQHEVTILAGQFTPVDAGLIPTGELRPVKGTPFDFTKSTAIGKHIQDKDEQIQLGHGYDHNFVLNSGGGSAAKKAAEVYEPTSGRVMEVFTTEPGLQFYTGNFLDGKVKGKDGVAYVFRAALCMETQHFPDSPNKPKFPSTELKPGQTYRTTTVYKFSAR
jgi:aldose 1-epimerase